MELADTLHVTAVNRLWITLQTRSRGADKQITVQIPNPDPTVPNQQWFDQECHLQLTIEGLRNVA